jgi:hypothetical protein
MNWAMFAIFAYLFTAAQTGLMPQLSVEVGWASAPVVPNIILLLGVTVGFYAPEHTTLLAWALIGLLVDLTSGYPMGGAAGDLKLIGPNVLGYLAGGYVVLQLRQIVFRQHPLSSGFAMFVCGLAAQLIVVLIMTLRNIYDPMPAWSALPQLLVRVLGLAYGAGIGVLLAVVMNRIAPAFGFQAPKSTTRRRRYTV